MRRCLHSFQNAFGWISRWLYVAIILTSLAVAADAPPAWLSLSEVRRIALERNWDVLAARSDVAAAVAQQTVAREFPNPQLAVSTTKINANGTSNATIRGNGVWERSYDTVIAVNQLLEIGGKRSDRRASSEAGVMGAEARLQDARRLLEHGVTEAYVSAVLAVEKANIMSDSAASLRREAGVASKRFHAGDITQSDLNQIEIAADRFELDASSAAQEVRIAKLAVEVLMGEKRPAGNWLPSDSLENLAAEVLPTQASAQPRPDLVAAQADLKKAENDLRLQRALRVPDPTLFLQYEHQPPDGAETVGVGVSFPIPVWNHNSGAIRAAHAAKLKAEEQQRRAEAQIAAEVALAQPAFENALTRYQRQRDGIEPKSASVRKSVAMSYEKGGASLLELLAAERSDNEVRLATAQAAADTAVALSALRSALNLSETNPLAQP